MDVRQGTQKCQQFGAALLVIKTAAAFTADRRSW